MKNWCWEKYEKYMKNLCVCVSVSGLVFLALKSIIVIVLFDMNPMWTLPTAPLWGIVSLSTPKAMYVFSIASYIYICCILILLFIEYSMPYKSQESIQALDFIYIISVEVYYHISFIMYRIQLIHTYIYLIPYNKCIFNTLIKFIK